jgi:demethylmenaquinone methyltransferase / 2-methoxy-6-polyprenyl-1,4-benzoquinol methylase
MTITMSEKSKSVQAMFDKIAPKYDFLNRLLSARQDVRWRKAMVRSLPQGSGQEDCTLVDVACGTGDVMLEAMKNRADYGKFVGLDISQGMLNAASLRKEFREVSKDRLSRNLCSQYSFQMASAESLPLPPGSALAVTIAFGLRNVDNRLKAISEFYRVITPGGKLLVLEFFQAESTFVSKLFSLYFHFILPFIGGIFSDRGAYRYLPQSVVTMPTHQEFEAQLKSAGFGRITKSKWLSGAVRLFVCEK